MLQMQYCLVKKVQNPQRGTPKSAGIDFFIPARSSEFLNQLVTHKSNVKAVEEGGIVFDDKELLIKPHYSLLIPSGVHVRIPENNALIAFPKSGIATKKYLDTMACLVDEDYQGEVHIQVTNTSPWGQILTYGEKIIQFVLVPSLYCELVQKDNLQELYKNHESERGAGGFGSTNGVKNA